jgi:hypothetical protein
MERLRIELARERLDLRRVDDMGCAGEALADVKILEIEPPAATAFIASRHCVTSCRRA